MNDLEASLTPKWLDDCIKEVSIHLGREWLDPKKRKSYNWNIPKQMAKQGDKEGKFVFKNLRDAPWEEPVFIIRGLECSRMRHNNIWNIGEEDIVLERGDVVGQFHRENVVVGPCLHDVEHDASSSMISLAQQCH